MQLRECDFSLSEHHANSLHVFNNGYDGALPESDVVERECPNTFDGGNNYEILNSSVTATKGLNCASERISSKRSGKSRMTSLANGTEVDTYPKSRMNMSKEPLPSDTDIKVQTAEESSRFIYSCYFYRTQFDLPFTELL